MTVTGRAARPRSARVWLPDRSFGIEAVPSPAGAPEAVLSEAVLSGGLSEAGLSEADAGPQWPQLAREAAQ